MARVGLARRRLGEQLAHLRRAAGLSQRDLAARTHYARSSIANVEAGTQNAPLAFWVAADDVLDAGGILREAYEVSQEQRRAGQVAAALAPWAVGQDDDEAAADLLARVAASDVSEDTISQLEAVVDGLATAYPRTPPEDLVGQLRSWLGYVAHLLDGRATLAQRRRLTVVAGWLALLRATVNIDLRQEAAAGAGLRVADGLAAHAGHDEIRAWVRETAAWQVLTVGDFRRAIDLAQAARRLAPAGSSIEIQATAQEGRAWARLGHARETYAALHKVTSLVAPRENVTGGVEHHYVYDPAKAVAYAATTLAWVGDPAGESFAREVIARLSPGAVDGKWPRRVATANLDLSLTLIVSGRLDEAASAAGSAIKSGTVVPSNLWRADEVVRAVEARQVPEAGDLREAFEALRRTAL